jgi:hypothetical protein
MHFPNLKQKYAVQNQTLYSFKTCVNISYIYVKFFQVAVLPSCFPKEPHLALLSVTHATCTTHFIPVHFAGLTYVTVLLLILKAIAMNEADVTQSPHLLLGSERRILRINSSFLYFCNAVPITEL